jgi:hypothetical protein
MAGPAKYNYIVALHNETDINICMSIWPLLIDRVAFYPLGIGLLLIGIIPIYEITECKQRPGVPQAGLRLLMQQNDIRSYLPSITTHISLLNGFICF